MNKSEAVWGCLGSIWVIVWLSGSRLAPVGTDSGFQDLKPTKNYLKRQAGGQN